MDRQPTEREDLRRHLAALSQVPSADQVQRLTEDIARAGERAYRARMVAQAAKLGVQTSGTLDHLVVSRIGNHAAQVARQVVATLQVNARKAEPQMTNMTDWQDAYAGWKADQIVTTETARIGNVATRDFYQSNPVLQEQTAHFEPDTAECQECTDLLIQGSMPISEAMDAASSLHVGCAHQVVLDDVPQMGVTATPQDAIDVGGFSTPEGIARPGSQFGVDETGRLTGGIALAAPVPAGINLHPADLANLLYLGGLQAVKTGSQTSGS